MDIGSQGRCFDVHKPAIVKLQCLSNPLLPLPSSASFIGAFGKRLFEPKDFIGEFPIAAHQAEQRRKLAVGGVVYFGYFLLDKQKKVTR